MKISIHSIGKTKNSDAENIIITEYLKRLVLHLDINEYATKEVCVDPNRQMLNESNLILEKLGNSFVVALDSKGSMLTSEEFAKFITNQQLNGVGRISFCIGGAYGHHKTLIDRADLVLSFGKMTLPHKLARVLLVEQIYRAETIINKHPYHK